MEANSFSLGSCTRRQRPRKNSYILSSMSEKPFAEYSDDFDQDAFEKKNASRRKFGLKSLSREEFLRVQKQVNALAEQQRQNFVQEEQQQWKSHSRQAQTSAASINILELIFSDAPQGCQTNDDCPSSGEVCCDLLFHKVCCSSGMGIGHKERYRPALVPVPVRSTNM